MNVNIEQNARLRQKICGFNEGSTFESFVTFLLADRVRDDGSGSSMPRN